MDTLDIDPNFEPQTRARSNTWPLPRPENYVDKGTDGDEKPATSVLPTIDQGQVPKKNSSRRNAWGNMSYADLISQAINSAPEKRLTLSQIYEWMVQNVPYFKDKGDSNSSAGWKNSIRHNLSLHNRFMRVQNEGTGKSSWWMINPEAKPGKAARRRAASMETKTYEKKRGRVKKKVEALRNGLAATPSPSSSVSEGLDHFPESPVHHGFQLSPDQFRPRASSNASSCSRLSPIPAVETDMHDNQAPPLSPSQWNAELGNSNGLGSLYGTSTRGGLDGYNTDQLVSSITETMKLSTADAYLADLGLRDSPPMTLPPMGGNTNYALSSFSSVYGSRSNGKYSSFQSTGSDTNALPPLNSSQQPSRSPQHILSETINGNGTYNLTNLQTLSPASNTHSLSPGQSMDTLTQANQTAQPNSYNSQQSTGQQQQQQPSQQQTLQGGFCHPPPSTTSLQQTRALLNRETRFQAKEALAAQSSMTPSSSASASLGATATHVMNHLLTLNNPIPNDLELFDSLQGGLECDVDQVIRHELSVDGNLDFNFADMNALNASAAASHNSTVAASRGNRTWVH